MPWYLHIRVSMFYMLVRSQTLTILLILVRWSPAHEMGSRKLKVGHRERSKVQVWGEVYNEN